MLPLDNEISENTRYFVDANIVDDLSNGGVYKVNLKNVPIRMFSKINLVISTAG